MPNKSENKRAKPNKTIKHQNYETTAILSILLTTLLTVSFTLIVTTAYRLESTFSILVVSTLVFSTAFTAAHMIGNIRELRFLSPALLILTPILAVLMISGDFFYSRQALTTLLYCIGEYSFTFLKSDGALAYLGNESITPMFNIINLVPMVFTTYLITNRKYPISALLFYIPYFLCASTNFVMTPDAFHFEATMAGVIILLVVHVTRNRTQVSPDKAILKLSVPILLITFALGIIFPDDITYNKDNLANNTIYTIREAVLNSRLGSNGFIRNIIDTIAEGRKTDHDDNGPVRDATRISISDTDLTTVGHLNPGTDVICNITLGNIDHPATDLPLYNIDFVYLKVDSKDTYEDSGWTTEDYRQSAFEIGTYFTEHNGLSTIAIEYTADSSVQLIPYYSDFYDVNGSSNVSANYSDARNPFCSTAWNGNGYYAVSTLPTRRDNHYSSNYLNDYVYGTNLEVPDSTRQAIIDTGLLPDWYVGLLNGDIEMSDADKIRMVTDYVSSLHYYDRNTDYPDPDMDFVAWFIAESDSGFCVHYATTATILLRMVGVPARYTEGYLANVGSANVVRRVTEQDAHAWFEVFLPEFGWIIGDPTPGNTIAVRNYNIDAIAAIYPEYEAAFDPGLGSDTSGEDGTSSDDTSATSESTSAPSDVADPTDTTDDTDTSDASDSTDDTSETTAAGSDTTSTPDTTTSADNAEPTSDDPDAASSDRFLPDASGDDISYSPRGRVHITALSVALIVLLTLFSILIIIRMIHVIYWRRLFNAPDIRERIISYYRYYKFINRFLKGRLTKKATAIAEKVAFSNESVTDKELDQLLESSSRAVESIVKKLPKYKKIIYRLIAVR